MKLYRVHSETGDPFVIVHDQKGNKDILKTENAEFEIEYLGQGWREGEYLVKINGEEHRVYVDNGWIVLDNAELFRAERITELPTQEGQSIEEMIRGKEGEVISPLQGRVVQIRVKEGDAVNKGQPLLSVEAMKSETIISAPISGIVEKILVKQGQG